MLSEYARVDDEASVLADLAQLTPDPRALPSLLAGLQYRTEALGSGWYASGDGNLPVLLVPLYQQATLAIRKRDLVGRHISRSATAAATLAALRSVDRRPPLLLLAEQRPPPPGIDPNSVVSLEGGVVPKIWRRCFGSFDALARIAGQRSHPGLPNGAVNAVEAGVPVLQALLHHNADLQLRPGRPGQSQDAPLRPRLTVSAAHGGSQGSVLPAVFDILVCRRYDPAESPEAALHAIADVVARATPRSASADVAITTHTPPLPDPDAGSRTREERALVAGWGWPQVPFCSASQLMPGAKVLGGLEHPDHDPHSDDATTTLDAVAALTATLRALLRDA